MHFFRALCFGERGPTKALCPIEAGYRQSQPGCAPRLCHSAWSAGLSRRSRSRWLADRPWRPAGLRWSVEIQRRL